MAGATAKLRLVAASVILVVWAAIYIRAAVDAEFRPPAELSAVMLAVVAWLFSSGALREMRRSVRADDSRGTSDDDR